MAFYTINKHLKQYKITGEQLTSKVFDYIFYGKGNLEKISEQTNIDLKVLDEMRSEFLYWYPVDMRISAKELLPNHLTFFLFQHTALFPDHLPKGNWRERHAEHRGKEDVKIEGQLHNPQGCPQRRLEQTPPAAPYS